MHRSLPPPAPYTLATKGCARLRPVCYLTPTYTTPKNITRPKIVNAFSCRQNVQSPLTDEHACRGLKQHHNVHDTQSSKRTAGLYILRARWGRGLSPQWRQHVRAGAAASSTVDKLQCYTANDTRINSPLSPSRSLEVMQVPNKRSPRARDELLRPRQCKKKKDHKKYRSG